MLQFFLFSFIPIFAISQNLFQNTVKIHLIQMGLWSQIDLKILQDSIQQQYNLSKRLFLTSEKDVSQNYPNSWSSYWKNYHLAPPYMTMGHMWQQPRSCDDKRASAICKWRTWDVVESSIKSSNQQGGLSKVFQATFILSWIEWDLEGSWKAQSKKRKYNMACSGKCSRLKKDKMI